jgi:hypothetical protein
MPPDPSLRAALERQLALLLPVVDHLETQAIAPSPLVSAEWRGAAAEAAERFVEEMRTELRHLAEAVDHEVRGIRLHLAVMT